jgi:hypothetical protein
MPVLLPVVACVLSLETPQRDVLPSEPVKLILKWQAREEACVAPLGTPGFVQITVWRDGDNSMGVYREYSTAIVMSGAPNTTTVAKGSPMIVSMYLVCGGYGLGEQHRPSFVFPTPGKYSLAIRGVQADKVAFESNRLSFDVREPESKDKEVFTIIARSPRLLLDAGPDAEKLLDLYPESPYLRYAKVARLRRWRNDLINRIDPHTGTSVGYGKGTEHWAAEQGRALADALLADGDWGAFEEERLFGAASFKQTSGDSSGARHLRKVIRERFPGSESAQAATELEDETTAWSGHGTRYKDGDMVTHQGHAWVCIQAHRSQPDWPPDRVPALWIKVAETKDWDHPVEYNSGDKVTYQGATYVCRQAHTSQAGWMPPNTPALWTRK